MSGEARPYGLPGPLPEGERVLWQDSPNWRALAWRVYHVREVLAYFAVFAAWRAASGWVETGTALGAVERASMVVPFAAVSVGLLGLLAYMTARCAVYTLTDRRMVLNVGIALSSTLNLPLAAIETADLRVSGKTGDLSLGLGAGPRIAFATLWPHARPWALKNPQPMLRAIDNPERVAAVLADALSSGAASRVQQPREASTGFSPEPAMAS